MGRIELIRLVVSLVFWSELLQIFPTKKWMVAADIFLWYSHFLRIWGHKTCILDVGKIPRHYAAPPLKGGFFD